MDGHEADRGAGPESSAGGRRVRLRVMFAVGVVLLLLIGVREMGDRGSSLPPPVVWTDAPILPVRWREDPGRAVEIELENHGGTLGQGWKDGATPTFVSRNLSLAPDWVDRFRLWCGAGTPFPECIYTNTGESRDVDGVRWYEFRR